MQPDWNEIGERTLALAQRLVATPSVVDTAGEAAVAHLLGSYLREQVAELPGVEVFSIPVDKRPPCEALLALCPAKEPTDRTLLLLGHFDTVGLEPYGPLAEIATDSERLKAAFLGSADIQRVGAGDLSSTQVAASARATEGKKTGAGKLPPYPEGGSSSLIDDVVACAASPDWAFGRGWHDMKGGVAAIVETFLAEARRGELPCNLMLGLTPDEESASRGMRALIPALNELRAERGLELSYVINADYTAPIHPGDDTRYFYSGTVGKLLLGISVFGKTTHVGEAFHGVNASALAGFLAAELEHNRKLMVGTGGEWLPPPTVLRVADRRERYDVMTIDCAETYINVFHLGGDPKKRWRELLNEVRRLVKRWDRKQRLQYNRFVARADLKLPRYDLRPEVIDFAELKKRVDMMDGSGRRHAGRPSGGQSEPSSEAQPLSEMNNGRTVDRNLTGEAPALPSDEREIALARIRAVHGQLPPGRPLVVVSLLPPFYPAQLNSRDEPQTGALVEFSGAAGLKHRRVYPYIADLSYFAFTPKAVDGWEANAPLWFDDAELAALRAGAAPVCNLGPWGAGAHSETERVYLPYLKRLPELLSGALHRLAAVETS